MKTVRQNPRMLNGVYATKHQLYRVWQAMLRRCHAPTDPGYENYGGRGIRVCERWFDFGNFVSDMGPKPSPELTLERLNNDGDYSPENCAWRSRTQQTLNRRVMRHSSTGITGVKRDGSGFAAEFCIGYKRYRIGTYGTVEDATEARANFLTLWAADPEKAIDSLKIVKAQRNSNTGISGITIRDGKFRVRVTVGGVRRSLGDYRSLETAIAAQERFREEGAA